MVSGILPRLYGLLRVSGWTYKHFFSPWFGHLNGSLLDAISTVLTFWVLAWLLDRKKIYIRV
jgi:predicted acyltransferase